MAEYKYIGELMTSLAVVTVSTSRAKTSPKIYSVSPAFSGLSGSFKKSSLGR